MSDEDRRVLVDVNMGVVSKARIALWWEVVRADRRGRITLRCVKPDLSIAERGSALLEVERLLRTMWPWIEVFLEPTGDMNALRVRLRGVKV